MTIAGGAAASEPGRRRLHLPAGRGHAMSVMRHPDFIKLTQLFILPQHQNNGIRTSLVRELALEARQTGMPLRLRVLKINPARRFYERLGFRVSSTTLERAYMELHA